MGASNEIKEFRASRRIVMEAAQYRRGGHDGVLLLNPSHHHAEMLAFHHYTYTLSVYSIHDSMSYLRRKTFLNQFRGVFLLLPEQRDEVLEFLRTRIEKTNGSNEESGDDK